MILSLADKADGVRYGVKFLEEETTRHIGLLRALRLLTAGDPLSQDDDRDSAIRALIEAIETSLIDLEGAACRTSRMAKELTLGDYDPDRKAAA